MPVRECREEIPQFPAAVPVPRHVPRRLHLGDPVHELPTASVDVVADRIDHHLPGLEPSGANHAGARKTRRPYRNAAPHVDAGVEGRPLLRKEKLAHGGVEAIAADDHIRALRDQRLASPRALKMCDGAAFILFDRDAFASRYDRVRAQALDNGIEQHLLQLTAMNRVLWMLVACVAAERLTVDELTEAIEEDGLLRQDRHARKRRVDSQFGERFGRMRQDVDAHAERTDLRCGLEDAARNSRTLQEKRERESADTGADDDDVQIPSGLECASI